VNNQNQIDQGGRLEEEKAALLTGDAGGRQENGIPAWKVFCGRRGLAGNSNLGRALKEEEDQEEGSGDGGGARRRGGGRGSCSCCARCLWKTLGNRRQHAAVQV
jgi:hypothetical protein